MSYLLKSAKKLMQMLANFLLSQEDNECQYCNVMSPDFQAFNWLLQSSHVYLSQ